ncbi:MAG: hypothetical protein ACI376_02055 [Candidatus Bruticola sp.]
MFRFFNLYGCELASSIGSCFNFKRLCAVLIISSFGLGACACSGKKEPTAPAPVAVSNSTASDSSSEDEEETFTEESSPYSRGDSFLQDYYKHKYKKRERSAVVAGVKDLLSFYSEDQLEQAANTILGYHYIVYHETPQHNLLNNHAVARQIETQLRTICTGLNVPFEAMWAIVSWENSGDISKVSFANAAGLGQITEGAVETAHAFGKARAEEWRQEAARLRTSEIREDKIKAERLEKAAKLADCEERHAELTKNNKLKDERLMIECNLEDSVLFFKYLLSNYGERVDLAISAYHNGVVNNDDVIYAYLRQVKDLNLEAETDHNRIGLFEALERYDLKYIDLWNNIYTREILCGLRTVYGDRVNEENASLALGDESDLYPWKVIASYAGLKAGDNFVRTLQRRYEQPLDFCEVRGLPTYDSVEKLKDGLENDWLCAIDSTKFKNFGVDIPAAEKIVPKVSQAKAADKAKSKANKSGKKVPVQEKEVIPELSGDVKAACWYASPELYGYLSSLQKRFIESSGNPNVKLPLKNISGAWALGRNHKSCAANSMETHNRGVAVDFALGKLPNVHRKILEKLILEDFLLDVVYIKRAAEGIVHVVINPRCGDDFIRSYVNYVSPNGKIAKALERASDQEAAQAREAAEMEAAKESANPQYSHKMAKERARREQLEAERLEAEAKAREAVQSRASAVKRRSGKKDPNHNEVNSEYTAQTKEEDELLAIPDEPINDGIFKSLGDKRNQPKQGADDGVYDF